MSRARAIETRLEKQLPILNEFFTSGFLTRDEIRELTRQRTHWEYRLVAKPLLLLDVQHAILYELSIEEKLQKYCIRSKLTLKHRWSVLERIEGIYRIGLKNLHNAAESELLRNEYVQFLKRFSRHASLSKMYAQMMIKFPTREDIWTEAALYEGMENNNMDNARVIIQRAIANMGQHSHVWCGALELELHFASRLLNGVIDEFEQEMLKKQESNTQTKNNGDANETEMMSINAQVEREAKELPSKLRNENEAMAHIMLDLALAKDVIDEAMVSKASRSPQLVREMINVMGKFKFTRSLFEYVLHVALRDGIKQAQSSLTSTISQRTREEWKAFLPTLICNLYLVKDDIETNYFTHILVNPETYLHKLGDNKPASISSKVLEKKHKARAKKDALINCIVHLYEFMYQCSVCVKESETESCITPSSLETTTTTTTTTIIMKSIDRQTLFSHAFDQLERCLRELAYYLPDGVSSVCSNLIKMAMMPHNITPSTKSSKSESNEKQEEILTEQTTNTKTKKNSKSIVMSENERIGSTEGKSEDTNFVMTSAFMLWCLTATHNRKSKTLEQTHTLQIAEHTVAELCSLLHWIPDNVTSVEKGKSNHKEKISAVDNQTQREWKTQNLWRTLPVNRLISLICDNDGGNDIQSELLKNVLCTSSSSLAEVAQLNAGKLRKTYSNEVDNNNINNINNNKSKRDNYNTEKLKTSYISRSQIEAFILWWKTQAKHETQKEKPQHDEEEEMHMNADDNTNDVDDENAAINKANVQELEKEELFAPVPSTEKEDYCVKRRQMLISLMSAHGLLPEFTSYAKALHGALLSNNNNNFTCQSVASLLLSRTTIEHIRQCVRKLQTSVSEHEEKWESQQESRSGNLSTVANSKYILHDFVMIWKLYNAMELMDGPLLHSIFCAKRQSKSVNISSDTDSDEEEETTEEAEWMHFVSNVTAQQIKQNTLQTYSSYAIAGLHILSFFTHEVRNRSLQMECTHGIYCLVRSALYNLTQLKKHITREHIVHILRNNYSNVREIIQLDAKCDELIDTVKLTSSPVSRYCYVNLILPVMEGLCLYYKQPMPLYDYEHDNIHSVNMDDWFAHCRHRCHYWLQAGRAIHESIIKLYTLTQYCETYVPLVYCGSVNTLDNSSKQTLEVKNRKRSRSSSVMEEHNANNALLPLQNAQHCCNNNKDNVNEYNTLDWLSYIAFERSVANDLQKSQAVVERARHEVLDPQLFITKLNGMEEIYLEQQQNSNKQ